MTAKLNIVVGGYIVGYPLGGMSWHHLNYLLGLRDLGHTLTFLEDGAYLPPFDPTTGQSGDPTFGLQYLRQTFHAVGLNIPHHYRFGSITDGLSVTEMEQALRSADLFVAVSGITPVEWWPRAKRNLVIDTDPVFTQLRMSRDRSFLDYYRWFERHATFGRLIGTATCPLPTHGFQWIGTNQPVHLPSWAVTPVDPTAAWTTIGKWEHALDRQVEHDGRTFLSSKRPEWEKLLDLPTRLPDQRFAPAMDGVDRPSLERFTLRGWRFDDAMAVSRSVGSFRDYISRSLGELTVAKQIYAGLASGWFSDRSACYLASGRSVVTQSSGFEQWLPTGEGLFCFDSLDSCVAAVRAVASDPSIHARAARALAERYFDATSVLAELIEHAMS